MQDNLEIQLQKHKSSSKKIYVLVGFILIAILGVAYYYFIYNKKNGVDTIVYNTKDVSKGDLQVSVLATGNLEPTNSVDIGIEVSGTIKEIYVDFNDEVKEGQILAKLDTVRLQTVVDSSKASLAIAKANLKESEVNVQNKKIILDRTLKMFSQSKGKFPSQNDVDDAQFAYNASIAGYEATKARVEQAIFNLRTDEDNLAKAVVKSSINGIVLNRAVEVGQTVAASMSTPTLFTLAKNLANMDLIVSIDEADVANLKENLDVDFTVDAYPNKTFKGKIKQVRYNPINLNGVITYETVVGVKNEELLLRPGMTANAKIFTKEEKDKILIPNAALRYIPKDPNISKSKNANMSLMARMKRPKEQTKVLGKKEKNMKPVWVLEDGTPKRVMVEVLISDGFNTAISSNELDENSKVIVSQSSGK